MDTRTRKRYGAGIMADTIARLRLRGVVESGPSIASVARTCGVAQSTVHGWLSGRFRPEPHIRAAIETIYGISCSEWDTEEERRASAAIVERAKAVAP